MRLQSTQDNLEELKVSDDLLEEALALSVVSPGTCSPRVTRSLKKIRRSSKKGAVNLLTTVLSNIV